MTFRKALNNTILDYENRLCRHVLPIAFSTLEHNLLAAIENKLYIPLNTQIRFQLHSVIELSLKN